MSRYEILVFLHITAVIIWLGSGFLLAVLMGAAERANDIQRRLGIFRDIGWLSTRLFIPASLSTVILGVILVLDADLDFGQLWIQIGLTGWLVSFLLGFLYFKPEGEKIGAMLEQGGATEDPEVDRRMMRVSVVDRFQVTVLFLIVADMVLKPTGDDGTALAIGGAVLALAFAMMVVGLRRQARPAV